MLPSQILLTTCDDTSQLAIPTETRPGTVARPPAGDLGFIRKFMLFMIFVIRTRRVPAAELGFDRRADVLGLAHLPVPFRNRMIADCYEDHATVPALPEPTVPLVLHSNGVRLLR